MARMIEWSETHVSIRDSIRRFCEMEVKPRLHAIEHEGEPPYEVLRKLVATFGLADMARMRFASQIERHKARGTATEEHDRPARGPNPEAGMAMAMRIIPI